MYPGDVVEVEVEGLGTLRNHIVSGSAPIRDDVGAQPTESEEVLGQRLSADSLVAATQHAGVLVMSEHERDATLGRIRAFLASRRETTGGEFTTYQCTAPNQHPLCDTRRPAAERVSNIALGVEGVT